MATLSEARKLAKRVWPSCVSIARIVKRTGCTEGHIASAGPEWSIQHPGVIDGNRVVRVEAPTRKAALAGLCAALEAMVEDKR